MAVSLRKEDTPSRPLAPEGLDAANHVFVLLDENGREEIGKVALGGPFHVQPGSQVVGHDAPGTDPLVAGSRQAIVATGISGAYFDRHFTLAKVINQPGDRRIVWTFSLNDFRTSVTDVLGYYSKNGQRIDTHSVTTTLGRTSNIVATISQGNLHSLSKLVEWARSVGAVQFRAQPLLRLGRGADISNQCLTNNQLNRMLLELSDLANIYQTRGLRCSVVGVSRRFLQAHPCGAYVCNGEGCHRRISQEIKKLVVREDGTVLPEITNLSHDFALGKIGDGPFSLMVSRYFEDGYARFDQLCRSIYAEVIPKWEAALIPWDQIVADRSQSWQVTSNSAPATPACGDCSTMAVSACLSSNPVPAKRAF